MERWRGLFFCACFSAVACAGSEPVFERANVVVVLIDTLRADHLHAYGYARPTSPHLDAFAGTSLLFENHRAQAPCTFPSVNSLLTSRYPAQFTTAPELYLGIPETVPTLAQILNREGYTTVAVSASPIVRNQPSKSNPHGGFGAGFDYFLEDCAWQEAACVNEALERRLDGLQPPLFLYLHYLDPHDPYAAPHPYRDRFAAPYTGDKAWVRRGDPNPLAAMVYADGPTIAYSAEDLDALIALYDAEITYVDAQFGHLVELLESRGILDQALVAVISDHGESFLEREHVKHCRSLLDSEIRTPFILRLPGPSPPRRLPVPTQNLDLVPTLLDYLGIDPEPSFDGRSLVPAIAGRHSDPDARFAAFASMDFFRSVADDRFKLIFELKDQRFALYDYRQDPAETKNILHHRRSDFTRLRRQLLEWIDEHDPHGSHMLGDRGAVQERLRALGYLE